MSLLQLDRFYKRQPATPLCGGQARFDGKFKIGIQGRKVGGADAIIAPGRETEDRFAAIGHEVAPPPPMIDMDAHQVDASGDAQHPGGLFAGKAFLKTGDHFGQTVHPFMQMFGFQTVMLGKPHQVFFLLDALEESGEMNRLWFHGTPLYPAGLIAGERLIMVSLLSRINKHEQESGGKFGGGSGDFPV